MKKKILLVDDEETLRWALHEALSEEGFDIENTNDSVKALAFTRKTKYDLVISDLKMPIMGGLQLISEIKKQNPDTLKNVIERAVLIATNGTLLPELVAPISSGKKAIVNNVGVSGESDEELDVSSLASVEKQHIQKVLNETSWRRTEAAKILGINRTTLYNKIKEYGISQS